MLTFFQNIFPNILPQEFMGSCDVLEHDVNPSTTVRKVCWTGIDGLFFDHALAQKLTSIFDKGGSPEILRKDCDGVLVFEHNGINYIFLTELKSGFGTERAYKAKRQLVGTFLKLNMVLGLANFYDRKNYVIKFIICGHPPKQDFLQKLHMMTNLPLEDPRTPERRFSRGLFFPPKKEKIHHLSCNASDLLCLSNFGIGMNSLGNVCDFYFVEVPEGDSSINLNVNDFL
ncbi:MAG: hypothetical protein K2H96_10650 [Muribaculaceae bacterium]|nr:hypothetical protein [Muribaculaceae bacterium]